MITLIFGSISEFELLFRHRERAVKIVPYFELLKVFQLDSWLHKSQSLFKVFYVGSADL